MALRMHLVALKKEVGCISRQMLRVQVIFTYNYKLLAGHFIEKLSMPTSLTIG